MEQGRLLFHHCMSFGDVRHGIFVPDPERSDPLFRTAFEWLADQVGFWPVFNSVGDSLDAYWVAGYDTNWKRLIAWSPETGSVLRKAGESPNEVLFSFENLDGVFIDDSYWHLVLNSGTARQEIQKEIGLVQRRWIFKPAWSRMKWIRYALQPESGYVLLLCPQLDLRKAGRIWVRNRETKRSLEDIGFSGVEVHRIPVLK